MIYFIADVHNDNFAPFGGPMVGGLNTRARYVLAALQRACDVAIDRPLVVLGDLFNKCQPSPVLTSHVQQILQDHGNAILLLGNHDQESGAYGHNALAPLAPVAHVVETPTVINLLEDLDTELWFAPFQAGKATDWLPETLKQLAAASVGATNRLLCVHMGLSDSKTPYYLDATAGSINVTTLARMCRKYDISHVFAGDWHRHQQWTRNKVHMTQVGALAPPRFPPSYEDAAIGPMVSWDPGTKKTSLLDIKGPRFVKLRYSQVRDTEWNPPLNSAPVFVRLTCRSDQVDEAKEWAEALKVRLGLLDKGGLLGGLDFDIDRGLERAKARTASFEARQANSLEEAISVYVQRMPVEDGVDRAHVLHHVRRLIGKRT